MKRKIFSMVVLALVSFPMLSQKNNVLSLHLQPLAIGELRLGFERTLTSNTSLVLNGGYVFKNQIPNFIYEEETLAIDGANVTTQNSITGYDAVAELRRYFGKNDSPNGFYIGVYAKYATYDFEMMDVVNYTFTGDEIDDLDPEVQAQLEGQSLDINVELDATSLQVGIGVQLGYQIIVNDRLAIDILALGLEMNQMNLDAKLVSPSIPVDYTRWEDEVLEASESWDQYPFRADVTAEAIDDGIELTADGILPWYRGGIKIGFAF